MANQAYEQGGSNDHELTPAWRLWQRTDEVARKVRGPLESSVCVGFVMCYETPYGRLDPSALTETHFQYGLSGDSQAFQSNSLRLVDGEAIGVSGSVRIHSSEHCPPYLEGYYAFVAWGGIMITVGGDSLTPEEIATEERRGYLFYQQGPAPDTDNLRLSVSISPNLVKSSSYLREVTGPTLLAQASEQALYVLDLMDRLGTTPPEA